MHAIARQAAAALVLLSAAGTAAFGAAAGHPQPIGAVTGDAERDTYGIVAVATVASVPCFGRQTQLFGPVTGDAEKDTYGYVTVTVQGSACPVETAAK